MAALTAARALEIGWRQAPTLGHLGLDKQLADVVEYGGLVLVDEPQNVTVGFHNLDAERSLGVQRVAHHHDPVQGQTGQQRRGNHNLVLFALNGYLGQHHARFGQVSRQQMHTTALPGGDGATQGFAVEGQHDAAALWHLSALALGLEETYPFRG